MADKNPHQEQEKRQDFLFLPMSLGSHSSCVQPAILCRIFVSPLSMLGAGNVGLVKIRSSHILWSGHRVLIPHCLTIGRKCRSGAVRVGGRSGALVGVLPITLPLG